MAAVLGFAPDETVYGPNATRLPVFLEAWARAWPGLRIEHQPTFANHPDLRGYGLAAGTYLALTRSLAYLRAHNASCDYHLMLEDDGVPFNGTAWPGGGGEAGLVGGMDAPQLPRTHLDAPRLPGNNLDAPRLPGNNLNAPRLPGNDLDARLDALEAAGGTALVLGGHRVTNFSRANAAEAAAQPRGGIVSAGRADGSYGYVLKCSAMAAVADHLHARLRQLKGRLYFEQALWDAFRSAAAAAGTRAEDAEAVYVSAPLLVDHAHGFSATWNRTVDRAFEGNATFWR